MSFNFSSLATTKPTSTGSYLKPYTINENVTIKSTEIKEGTSSNGNPWKSLVITFGNDEGTYSDSMFWITRDEDFQRSSMATSNGGQRELPSAWERTRDKMAAIGFAFFPDTFEKLKAVSSKAKSFDDIAMAFKKLADAAIDKNPTSMKLVGRNSGGRVYATLPNCTGIAQANDEKRAADNGVNVGDWYTWMVSPFGDKLFFSAYEEQQRDSISKAKPTQMPDEPSTSEDSEFNLEDLL